MQQALVSTTISRSNRNLLILALVGLVGLASFGALSYRYYASFFSGPRDIRAEELIAAGDADTIFGYYVNVAGEEVLDTGYSLETRRNGVLTSTKNYLALLVGDRVLLVETPDMAITPRFTGALIDIPSDVQKEVVGGILAEEPRLEQMLLPMMLRDDNFQFGGYVGLVVAAIVLALSGYGLFTATQRMGDPARHPILRALGRFGDTRQVVSDIEGQLATNHSRIGDIHLTPTWLVQLKSTQLAATRFDDIVWVYKQVTQHRTNGVPTSKTFVAQIYDRHGVALPIQAKEDVVNETLAAVMQRAPWAIAGHSAELEQAWKQSRAAVISAADQRRQQLMAAMR